MLGCQLYINTTLLFYCHSFLVSFSLVHSLIGNVLKVGSSHRQQCISIYSPSIYLNLINLSKTKRCAGIWSKLSDIQNVSVPVLDTNKRCWIFCQICYRLWERLGTDQGQRKLQGSISLRKRKFCLFSKLLAKLRNKKIDLLFQPTFSQFTCCLL